MWISELTILNCRIIKQLKLEFSPHINFIYGCNGSGKTSILEGLSLLSHGRSFRTSRIAEIIKYNEDSVLSSAIVNSETYGIKRIGIKKSRDKTTIRVDRNSLKSQASLSILVPISVIHPLSHLLITGGSFVRRNFIDWIAFYKHPEFHDIWKRYHLLLKQRNAALKNPKLYYALDHLTVEMCKLQRPIQDYRASSLEELHVTLNTLIPKNLKSYIPDIELNSGFPKNISLEADALVDYYQTVSGHEKNRGRTIKGVHAANLSITLDSVPVSSSASRGQTKIISTLLHICQNLAINQDGVICIDDLSAEVDASNYGKLFDFILSLGNQTFITSTTEPSTVGLNNNYKMFHVEQGVVTE